MKETAHWLIQELIELDVSDEIGADRYQRSDERRTYRNGSRQRTLNTRLGDLEISIPKLREGSYYPEWLLGRGRPAEKALLGVVMEAYVNRISTRKIERMVRDLVLSRMGVRNLVRTAAQRSVTTGSSPPIRESISMRCRSFLPHKINIQVTGLSRQQGA